MLLGIMRIWSVASVFIWNNHFEIKVRVCSVKLLCSFDGDIGDVVCGT